MAAENAANPAQPAMAAFTPAVGCVCIGDGDGGWYRSM